MQFFSQRFCNKRKKIKSPHPYFGNEMQQTEKQVGSDQRGIGGKKKKVVRHEKKFGHINENYNS